MSILRTVVLTLIILSRVSEGWTCEDLIATIDRFPGGLGLVEQRAVGEALSPGNPVGFCGSTCVANLGAILRSHLTGTPASATIEDARRIVNSFAAASDIAGMTAFQIHQAVRDTVSALPAGRVGSVISRRLGREYHQRTPDNFQDVDRISIEDILGTENNGNISVVGLSFYDHGLGGREAIAAHGLVIVPLDIAGRRVRVLDPRFRGRIIYARIVESPLYPAPYLEFEDRSYVNYYNQLLTQRLSQRHGWSPPVNVDLFLLNSVTSIRER